MPGTRQRVTLELHTALYNARQLSVACRDRPAKIGTQLRMSLLRRSVILNVRDVQGGSFGGCHADASRVADPPRRTDFFDCQAGGSTASLDHDFLR